MLNKQIIYSVIVGGLAIVLILGIVAGIPYFTTKYSIEEYTKEMTTVINTNTATINQIVQFLNQSQAQTQGNGGDTSK